MSSFEGVLGSGIAAELSRQARAVWAKYSRADGWLTLPQHLLDSYGVGCLLFDEWLAPHVKARWGSHFPGGDADARVLFGFVCASHDVGKASPSFVCQVETLAERGRRAGLPCPSFADLKRDRASQPHSVVSAYEARRWLEARGVGAGLSEQIGSMLGAHHGRPASKGLVVEVPHRPRGLGGAEWAGVRDELLDWAGRLSGLTERLPAWEGVTLPLSLQVTMTGLLIMADWIASNQDYFRLRALDAELSPTLDEPRGRWLRGWDAVALPGPWTPSVPSETGIDLYRSRFGWREEWVPTPMQTHVVERAAGGDVGLMIVESTMGSGKTEAALAAAELLAAARGCQGMLIALPTQATTNAMFERVRPWVDRQPPTFSNGVPWSIVLGHGKASLNPTYAQMVEQVRLIDEQCGAIDSLYDETEELPDAGGDDFARAVAHQWFNGRKRRLLHNFVVSTIDQLLMAGTRSKHQMLNHVALAGKVIVVDEAHASDAYMNVFLDAVLPWLGEYRAPVIVLSATLTPQRRQALIDAYCGRALPVPPGDERDYPLVTTVDFARERVEVASCPDNRPARSVAWEWLNADPENILAALRDAMPEDGCALIVRNTVRQAQATFDLIEQSELGPVTLAHSRFMAVDRAAREAELVKRFGPSSTIANGRRPRRHVLVATQVVEQSLDVDFDLLLTDLAPADLLFQRIGRLHRHDRERPAALERARMLILRDPERDAEGPPRGDRGSHQVYGDHLLLRTSAALQDHGQQLTLPDDIAPLVARALGAGEVGRPEWRDLLVTAASAATRREDAQRDTARAYALEPPRVSRRRTLTMANWLSSAVDGHEETVAALVRDTDPTLEVVVVPMDPDGQVITPPWLGGEPLDVRTPPDRLLALMISSWALRLPPQLTRTHEDVERLIQVLEGQAAVRRWSWRENPLLRGELFLPMTQVQEGSDVLESTLFDGWPRGGTLRYSPARGLEVIARG